MKKSPKNKSDFHSDIKLKFDCCMSHYLVCAVLVTFPVLSVVNYYVLPVLLTTSEIF